MSIFWFTQRLDARIDLLLILQILSSSYEKQVFTGISAVSISIAILSQLGALEFVSFSADNPATYKLKEMSTVTSSKSLDTLKAPVIEVPASELQSAPAPMDEFSSLTENKQTTPSDSKSDE